MNNTSDLADLIFTGKTSDIPAPQIYRLALRWTLFFSQNSLDDMLSTTISDNSTVPKDDDANINSVDITEEPG